MTMEDLIQEFIRVDDQEISGDGCGSGNSTGDGYGFDYDCMQGYCDGSGYGGGSGCGDGSGDSSGSSAHSIDYGSGYGTHYGDGYGHGSGYNLKTLNSRRVYLIDNTQTIISQIRGNIAKGYIVQGDLILRECYVVKQNNLFAHGNTLHDAYQALQEKLYNTSTEEERISAFKEKFQDFDMKYPAKDLFSWHHILTGSCRAGREAFCRDHEIDVENDSFTIHEFIRLTKDSYNGEIIQKLLD